MPAEKKRGKTKHKSDKNRRKMPGEITGVLIIFAVWVASIGLLVCKAALASNSKPENLPILQAWSGDYPVSQLNRLPQSQRTTPVGYLGNSAVFADVWQAFKPSERVPTVDFSRTIVVFSRNVSFYNRSSIAKVVLKDGAAEIIAIETRSAMPIEDRVAMAMAVIPGEGVRFIQVGTERIPVASLVVSGDPLNASYMIERRKVRLVNGHHEEQATFGSATKIKSMVFGKPVYGDLDGDGDEDVALFLVQDPGGSGTFYYVAAALRKSGIYRGTNAVFLGDRISPRTIKIQKGVIIVDYADRRPDEPMAASPSVVKDKYLVVKNGRLEEMKK